MWQVWSACSLGLHCFERRFPPVLSRRKRKHPEEKMSGFHGIPSGSSLFMGTTPMTTPRPAPMIIKYEHLPEDDYASTAAAAEAATSALTQCQSVTDSHVQLTDQNIHTAENGLVEVQPPPVVDIDIVINNVVCTFTTKCHLNLKRIAMEGVHVEYRRENGVSISFHCQNLTKALSHRIRSGTIRQRHNTATYCGQAKCD